MADSHRFSVHQALGNGAVADVLLWRRKRGAIFLLLGTSTMWFLFERAGYNLLSFVSNVLLLLIGILFFWAKSASLLNRPLPPIPDLEISEESVVKAAEVARLWVNPALSVARDIAISRNLRVFVKVVLIFSLISFVGSFFNFLTLVYIVVLLSLSVPVLYEKYQVQVDEKLNPVYKIVQAQYRNFDDHVLKKIPIPSNKEKKVQ